MCWTIIIKNNDKSLLLLFFFSFWYAATDGRAPPVINNCPQEGQPIVYETFNSVNCSARYTEPSSIQAGVAVTVSPANSSPLNNYAIGDYLIVYSFTNQQGYQTDCAITLSVIRKYDISLCPTLYYQEKEHKAPILIHI